VNFAAGIPSRWLVTLHSGSVIELAADAYREADGYLLFNVLVEATPEEQAQMVIDLEFPNNPLAGVLVARIPAVEVANIETSSWVDDGSESDV
jgi:hypothetical protein